MVEFRQGVLSKEEIVHYMGFVNEDVFYFY